MEAFKQGFYKQASECGLSPNEVDHIWKVALEYPGTAQTFKNLNIPAQEAPVGGQPSTEELQVLSNLMQNEKVDQEMAKIKQTLGI